MSFASCHSSIQCRQLLYICTMAHESFTVNLMDKRCSQLVRGLKLSPWQPDVLRVEEECPPDAFSETQLPEVHENLSVSSKMSCSVCACSFQTRIQQREHYKLDWHRFNLKQSMMGAESVSEEHFESMTEDISSISGSDISDNETTSEQPSKVTKDESQQRTMMIGVEDAENNGRASGRGPPKIFFENGKEQLLAIYRCLLQSKKENLLTQSELVSRATKLGDCQKWAILMVAGGHFAAAIFQGSEVVSHKTFHRYTVRAKRGTAQGVRDGQQGGNQPRSAGASLRRYNEAQLHEDVANLMKSWKDQMDGCSHIFIRAPSHNRALFFGGKNPSLRREDGRVRTMPFPTRRPTFKEVKRVQGMLSTVECFDNFDAAKRKFSPSRGVTNQPLQGSTDKRGDTTEDMGRQYTSAEGVQDGRVGGKPRIDRTDARESSDDEEVELFLEEVTSSTSHLRETEISLPKKRQRRKKKNALMDDNDGLNDKELKRLQSALYTLCKTNEGEAFEYLMMQIQKKFLQDIEKESVNTKLSADKREDRNPETECGNSPRENSSKDVSVGQASIGGGNNSTKILGEDPGTSKITGNSVCEKAALRLDDTSLSNGDPTNGPLVQDSESTELVENGDGPIREDMGSTSFLGSGSPKGVVKRVAEFLNEKLDPLGNRLLHIAAINGHSQLVRQLMIHGADPAVWTVNGVHPITMAKGKSTRLEFSRFRGEHPEKFDYKAARIPAPLTEEQEAAKVAKMKEKRKMQKKARGIKQKERKEEQQRKDKEEAERQAFVALSDREKRALAAEKRLASQISSSSRCFSCGSDLAGRTPFHYQDFKFCTMPCLKKHKQQQPP